MRQAGRKGQAMLGIGLSVLAGSIVKLTQHRSDLSAGLGFGLGIGLLLLAIYSIKRG